MGAKVSASASVVALRSVFATRRSWKNRAAAVAVATTLPHVHPRMDASCFRIVALPAPDEPATSRPPASRGPVARKCRSAKRSPPPAKSARLTWAGQGRSDVASTRAFRARAFEKRRPRVETAPSEMSARPKICRNGWEANGRDRRL